MITLEKETEKLVLVGVAQGREEETESTLDELAELAATAGAVVVGRLIQRREAFEPHTYIGKGKLAELKDLLWECEATGILCDDELTPVQLKHLNDDLGVKVMDRTLVILDIFAGRASTSEGKIQVELAQLKYRQSRLTGLGQQLSRLGGGIGTRGPGEKKLEQDRRLIKGRIAQLERELGEVKRHRAVTRQQRQRNRLPVAAIVGYTNAGKSTLLNRLTGAGILAEDKLFATLDPTTRARKLGSGQEILLTDTVGFIQKLPHHLIEAFKSTLEEAKYADLLLHIVDAADPRAERHMYTVYETLRQLGVADKPIITVFNKQDLLSEPVRLRDFKADCCVSISARTGAGFDNLLLLIETLLREQKIYVEALYPFAEAGKLQLIRQLGELLAEEYRSDGIFVRAYVPPALYERVRVSRGDSPKAAR